MQLALAHKNLLSVAKRVYVSTSKLASFKVQSDLHAEASKRSRAWYCRLEVITQICSAQLRATPVC